MRQIEQWMMEEIRNQRAKAFDGYKLQSVDFSKEKDNTKVTTRTRQDNVLVTNVYLHGNLIAQYSTGKWGFKMCGWNTPTTRSRINVIAGGFGQSGVRQRKGKLYSAGKEINSLDWF